MLKQQLIQELKRLKFKIAALLMILVVVAVGGSVWKAKAFSSESAPKVVVEGDYIEAPIPVDETANNDEILGSVVSSQWLEPMTCSADDCTYHATGNFTDASTTLFGVATPFRTVTSSASDVVIEDLGRYGLTAATSTVELVRLLIDGTATTTYRITCGSAPTRYTTSTSGNAILNSSTVVTSSPNFLLENNLGSTSGSFVTSDSIPKIVIGPKYPYLVCKVDNTYGETGPLDAFTNAENTFDGHFVIRFSRPRF